jgi:hypothetical protein
VSKVQVHFRFSPYVCVLIFPSYNTQLHEKQLLHLNLQPKTIRFTTLAEDYDTNPAVLLTNFALMRIAPRGNGTASSNHETGLLFGDVKRSQAFGELNSKYCAPEIGMQQVDADESTDLWSVAALLHKVCCCCCCCYCCCFSTTSISIFIVSFVSDDSGTST